MGMISFLTIFLRVGHVKGGLQHEYGWRIALRQSGLDRRASFLSWHLSMYRLHMTLEVSPFVGSQQYRSPRLAGFGDGIILLLVQIMVGGRPGVEIPR